MNPISAEMTNNPIHKKPATEKEPKTQIMADVDGVARDRIAEGCCECCTPEVRMYTGIVLIATCILAPCGFGLALSGILGEDD